MALQGMERLRAVAERLAKAWCAVRHDHEFLEVERILRMLPAIDHVHHRHWQAIRSGPAEILVKGQAEGTGGGAGDRHRHAENGVGAEC